MPLLLSKSNYIKKKSKLLNIITLNSSLLVTIIEIISIVAIIVVVAVKVIIIWILILRVSLLSESLVILEPLIINN